MKKIVLILLSISWGITAKSQFQKAELQASGLTCSMCSKAVNNALQSLPFVESIQTDLNKNIFTVVFKPGSKPDFDLLKMKVQGAGFSIANLWVYAFFNQLKVKDDEHVPLGGINLHFMHIKPQVLHGEKKIQIIDKNFVSAKSYKQSAAYTAMECYKTGVMSVCCNKETTGAVQAQRIYHVTM